MGVVVVVDEVVVVVVVGVAGVVGVAVVARGAVVARVEVVVGVVGTPHAPMDADAREWAPEWAPARARGIPAPSGTPEWGYPRPDDERA
jgi:hypothetical protein